MAALYVCSVRQGTLLIRPLKERTGETHRKGSLWVSNSRRKPRLSHGKEIELIAIQISKITCVEALAPRAGRAFVLGTEL